MSKRQRQRDYKAEYKRRKHLRAMREEGLARAAKPRSKVKIKRKRDYKKEYQRRQVLELKAIVERDARRVFGKKPKRQGGEGASEYEDKLSELQAERDRQGVFEWTNEQAFIGALTNKGMPIQEAYTMWFSP